MLEALLAAVLSSGSGERCVVVSSFTRTLDAVAALCARNGWSTARVAGDIGAAKRQDAVHAFNSYGVGQAGRLCPVAGCSVSPHAEMSPAQSMHVAVRRRGALSST